MVEGLTPYSDIIDGIATPKIVELDSNLSFAFTVYHGSVPNIYYAIVISKEEGETRLLDDIEIYGDYYNKTTETSTTTPPTTTITTTSANVSYSIHLGNFDFSQGGSYGDYNVIRNNHYKYKVIVNGVEDIIAEAVIENATDNDDNPYAEGLVIRLV